MANWRWKQSTGELFHLGHPVLKPVATGYAGSGTGRNNPEYQGVGDIGPIPQGKYYFDGESDEPTEVTLILRPDPANQMFGRTGFLIHGDSAVKPGWASEGCIILGKETRTLIRDANKASGTLEVVE